MWKRPDNIRKEVRTQTKDNRWVAVLLVCATFFCVPAGVIFSIRASEALSNDDIRLFLGIGITAVLFLLCAAMLSMFIMAYSRLRRIEEHEDDIRELALTRTLLGNRPETRYNYTIRPGQAPLPYSPLIYPGGFPQQPKIDAAPEIEYIDEDVNLGG